jgi:nicotinamide phosphoribosyltransferase
MNVLLNTDSYKASHFLQYPPGTDTVSSYIEPRGGEFPLVLFFGLQAFLKQLKPFTQADIDEAESLLVPHGLPFHRQGWEHILNKHGGNLPIEIQALPEGMVLPIKNAVVQLHNTDPACAWLTSYLETALLRAVWYPSTVATLSWHAKQVISRYLDQTADNSDGLPFKLHDFGARGVSSEESAALGGMAHLVNFMGSDTLSAIVAAKRYYREPMAGFSIPAAEHSTITSWGRMHEIDAYANMLEKFGKGLVAVVSDSYDLWNAIDNLWGDDLREQVQKMGGTLVVRPDSGEPTDVVPLALSKLMDKFGYTVNSKGYKQLPACVRLIQGDGINLQSLEAICAAVKQRGFSTDNLAFGMGGALLQQVNRDTLQWAMKASAAHVQGQWRDVFKDPITSSAKKSKKGRLAVVPHPNHWAETVRLDELAGRENLLQPVFRNGELLKDWTFAEVRGRAK